MRHALARSVLCCAFSHYRNFVFSSPSICHTDKRHTYARTHGRVRSQRNFVLCARSSRTINHMINHHQPFDHLAQKNAIPNVIRCIFASTVATATEKTNTPFARSVCMPAIPGRAVSCRANVILCRQFWLPLAYSASVNQTRNQNEHFQGIWNVLKRSLCFCVWHLVSSLSREPQAVQRATDGDKMKIKLHNIKRK